MPPLVFDLHDQLVAELADVYVLPFVEEQDVDVRQFGDQLVVQVENQRRHYVLPNFLGYYTLHGHTLREDGWLEVRFAREKETG